MRTRITPRDTEVIKWIAILRFLKTSFISQFFFSGNTKVARRRLYRLTRSFYLSCFEVQENSCGRGEHVFYLNKQRREEIKYLLGSDNITFYSPPKNPIFVSHDLEIARFILCLKSCCDTNKEYSFYCLPGHEVRSAKRKGDRVEGLPFIGRHKASFVADSLLLLEGFLGKSILFLEIDTGKEVIAGSFRNKADFSKKLKAYMDYLACRGYQRLSKRFGFPFKGFRILVVTTPTRLPKIEKLCREINSRGVVWLTCFDQVTPETLFNPVWAVPCSNKKELQAIVKKQVKGGSDGIHKDYI